MWQYSRSVSFYRLLFSVYFHQVLVETKYVNNLFLLHMEEITIKKKQTEDYIDPHSFYYDRRKKQIIKDTKIFSREQNTKSNQVELLKESNENCEAVKIYYKRLIMKLLLISKLKNDDDNDDDDDTLKGQLFVKGTRAQIETLRKIETDNYSLKEIDIILSKILLEPSFYNNVSDMFDLYWISQSALKFIRNYYAYTIMVACSILGIVILFKHMPYFSPLFIIIVVIITVSFFQTWWQLITEAEIKLAASQMKYIEMPISCRPSKMNLWEKINSYLFNAIDCEKYYEARMSNPMLQVTPAMAFSHMVTTFLTHPISIIGTTMSQFISNATDHLPIFIKYMVQVLLYILLPVFLLVAIFICRGGSVRFGLPFISSLLSFEQTSLPPNSAQKRQTIELIREIFAEVPPNILLKNTESVKAVLSSDTFEEQKNNSPTDNAVEESSKLRSIEFVKKLDHASGDSNKNNLFSEETEEESEKCLKEPKIDTEKYIGGGDG
ncbi:chloride channel CLIC-like protein 1 isoform X2 [Vespa crabro]|uniref:chloride channel CLIC-like protein 1 isoform X2 n=1 Tax=Vespa crabro TaxID=7445 RepID=UPI001F023A75|nr:chloride channel CLIC-like protein 1 isoform X2 [Vespa crabro]